MIGNADQVGSGTIQLVSTTQAAIELDYDLQAAARLGKVVAVDTETVGINPKTEAPSNGNGRIVCWSVSWQDPFRKHSKGFPLGTRVFIWNNPSTLQVLKPWLEGSASKVGHNILSYDAHLFSNHGVKLGGVVADTLRMHQLLKCGGDVQHGLKSLMKWWLGYELGAFADLFSRPKRLADEEVPETKYCKRKVGETKAVHTLICAGTLSRFSPTAKELIPLDTVARDYPQLLPMLYDYATLDAKATLELYYLLKDALHGEY